LGLRNPKKECAPGIARRTFFFRKLMTKLQVNIQ
jgi:hypothetical protein